MFGYTFPIEPMMTNEEQAAYRAYYCETCHQLRDGYGVMSTVIVSYEMTFANIILNSVLKGGVIDREPKAGKLCVFRHSDNHTELLRRLAAYTVLVANNGLIDDKLDGPSIKSNFGLLWLNRSIERAKRDFPQYDELIMKGYEMLREKEAAGCDDPIEMGKASAASMIWVLREMVGEVWTPDLEALFEGMGIWVYVLDAIEDAGFAVALSGDRYLLTAPNEVAFTMEMQSDDRGVLTLSFETYLCPDPTDDSAVSAGIRAENEQSVEALRRLFDAVMPVFHRSIADSETIVTQCKTVVKKGTSYAKRLGDYSVRILTDPDALVQSVTVTLSRDS